MKTAPLTSSWSAPGTEAESTKVFSELCHRIVAAVHRGAMYSGNVKRVIELISPSINFEYPYQQIGQSVSRQNHPSVSNPAH